ncbi:succinyldiaminopimelate transaminase [Corynebacterium striatum]|uniref:Succinyldiaminopimelate transaminase n=1 Tax=Corynebacterium striatum TaxID=43770 RepID=A0A2Z2J4X4_CORST|nr:succinyldiaminopimelate transaminase [Corynebacterium striatum]ART21567.1 succinyldiaminopimelate transaminase [Corynebacterium striatum]HAT1151642.1 succinyldiaminopimelate transaminase [Corynebacterium striatum]HAT1180174.1 succinyldiaminopimelate transaminase [Corynebacterium striatum]HAT1241983.1 succinyldiaminopimelate transaminase [Corynebacterium striatum]HAT1252769.1 succinyldiaminopimelate transaminase [Corynebacterium striatum]
MARQPLENSLPDFPWNSLAEAKKKAQSHPDGIVDLSVGNPVDPVAPGVQLAMASNAEAPGYPTTAGTARLQEAIRGNVARRTGTEPSSLGVLPVIGLKESIAWLPTLLGMRGQRVIIPSVAYPTYEVGALIAGALPERADDPRDFGDAELAFINSPSNPTGRVMTVEEMRTVVAWARENNAIVASDECYLALAWDDEKKPVSILDPRVTDGDNTGLIAMHSLSKSHNLASYRTGFFAGDQALIAELLELRKHAGLIVPGPIQAAMVEALNDDDSETLQVRRYAGRRAKLLRALTGAGFRIEHSEASMYLWATRDEQCRITVDWLAERGILVAPGDFYGPSGDKFVRIGLNGTDERIDAAVARLAADN